MTALVSTVGVSNANSYASEAEADDYLDSRVGASSWAALTSSAKETALITAGFQLDDRFIFVGVPTTTTQAMSWPRYDAYIQDMYGITDSDIPERIKRAQIELAWQTLSNGNSEGGSALDSVKVGPIEVDFDESNPTSLVPEYIRAIVMPLGDINSASTGGKGVQQAALVR